ncbi:MAG: ROK family protein, partial [Nanoarchaeota archaeon]
TVTVSAAAKFPLPSVVKKIRLPTDAAAGREKVLDNIVAAITSLYNYGRKNIPGFKLRGIGVGTAGFLKNGRLEMVPNIPAIRGARLKDYLQQQLRRNGIKAPLFVENDSICFALAEFMFGAARGCKNVIGVIVGTGIGGGLILDGKIYRGRDGGAGHIGHTMIDHSGPRCGCGQKGHFESWCSGKYITQRYVAAGGKIKNPDPRKIIHSKEAVARKIMLETYEKFGIAFANLINTFNPDIIVIGGGVSNLPNEFYRKTNAAAKKYAYSAFSDGLRIVKNRLGDAAGVYGAAALALHRR